MAFHIPFNQRASAHTQPGVVYIGFEVPRPPKKKFNWWGFNGMWMSFLSLLSVGFLSPVPLLISLVGLRREGKKMASIGTLVSLAGVALAVTVVSLTTMAHQEKVQTRRAERHNQMVSKQVAETNTMIALAADEVEDEAVNGVLPSAIESNIIVIEHIDPWGESLRFDMESDGGLVRSAGPDKQFDTGDDLTLKVDGKSGLDTTLIEVSKPNITVDDLMED